MVFTSSSEECCAQVWLGRGKNFKQCAIGSFEYRVKEAHNIHTLRELYESLTELLFCRGKYTWVGGEKQEKLLQRKN